MTTYFDHDPELPAGFQDADILQAAYEAESRAAAASRARGICNHGCRLSHRAPAFYSAEDIAEDLKGGHFGNRGGWQGAQNEIPASRDLCLDCGELVEPFDFDR